MPDTMIALEHAPTYTAGRQTQPGDAKNPSIPVIPVDRGGRITYHGPGQLVLYPIFKARQPVDVIKYVYAIENSVIATLNEHYGLKGKIVKGRSGVWLDATDTKLERKICALGVKFARDTTLHGLALNVTTDLTGFGEIIPCGINDADVASIEGEGIPLSPNPLTEAATYLIPQLTEELYDLRIPERTTGLSHASAREIADLLTASDNTGATK